jgi:hypothetical protein
MTDGSMMTPHQRDKDMNANSNVTVVSADTKRGLAWFLSLHAVWKLTVLELAVYLVLGIAAVLKFAVKS